MIIRVISFVLILFAVQEESSADVVFNCNVNSIVQKMNVYTSSSDKKMDKMAMENQFTKVLKEAGIAPTTNTRVNSGMFENKVMTSFVDSNFEGRIEESGTEIIFTNLDGLKLDQRVVKLPNNQQAVAIATRFLEVSGLISPTKRQELVLTRVGGISQALATRTRHFPHEKKASVVYFNRTVDGFPVRHHGASITVAIGDNFKPVGLNYFWRKIDRKKTMAVSANNFVAVSKVKSLVTKDLALIYDLKAEKIAVDKIYPVYYSGVKYIQPAFCYEGRELSNQIHAHPVLGYVSALVSPPEPVYNPGYMPGLTFDKSDY